jgi:hypothetical protein
VYYFHHENKSALESSAEDGCHFCGMIWARLFGSGAHFSGSVKSFAGEQVYLRRTWTDEWIKKEGADALECSEWLIAECEGRHMYSSNSREFSRMYPTLYEAK